MRKQKPKDNDDKVNEDPVLNKRSSKKPDKSQAQKVADLEDVIGDLRNDMLF